MKEIEFRKEDLGEDLTSQPSEPKCSCLEDNKLSQALCPIHGKSPAPTTSEWEEELRDGCIRLCAFQLASQKEKIRAYVENPENRIILHEGDFIGVADLLNFLDKEI